MASPQSLLFRLSAPHCFLLLLLAVFGLAGCQTTQNLEDKYGQDYEETVYGPYTPRDDGIPLTAEELRAFKTRGELDAKLSQEDAQIVELHFKYFVHERRGTFERFLTRSSRFLPHIKKVFNERGIPEEIAYLCMVESGGNPNAVSPAGAAGLWQFMPFTGRKYGLTQNTWIDERRDPFKSTYAASDYLLKLYGDFKDWHLAVAAYNAGEGKIGRAVEGTGATDFFELCRLDCALEEKARLREETRIYVPRLIAVAKIMRNLRRLGFQEPAPDAAWNLDSIDVPPGTNLAGLARQMGLTWDEFSGMNPAFKRTASPPTSTTVAYVPPEHKLSSQTWVAGNEARTYAGWKEYSVRKKDTLASISKRHNVSVASLREANGFTKLPKVGSVILIPGRGGRVEPVYDALPAERSSAIASAGKYRVGSGDTLYSLAKTWGTDVESIRKANRMGSGDDKLRPGQRLSIPGNSKNVSRASAQWNAGLPAAQVSKATASASGKQAVPARSASGKQTAVAVKQTASPKAAAKPAAKKKKTVTVGKGDTLYALSRKHNTSVEALMKANGLRKGSSLKPGQKLIVP